jgi:hypothetical protein
MTDEPDPPGMAGPSPSKRGLPAVPDDPAEHALRVAREWADMAETYVRRRMKELGIPEVRIGAIEHAEGRIRRAFSAGEQVGGTCDQFGRLYVDSGCLNPKLLVGKGSRLWPKSRLRDRIDAIIAHEYEEDRRGSHEAALKAAAWTELKVSDGARRILKAMAG